MTVGLLVIMTVAVDFSIHCLKCGFEEMLQSVWLHVVSEVRAEQRGDCNSCS